MTEKFKFIVHKYRTAVPVKEFPTFLLTKDTWDDYGHKVKYQLKYFTKEGVELYIGPVKILQHTASTESPRQVTQSTDLESVFSELDTRHLSIGQEDEYYSNLYDYFGKQAREILHCLNDLTVNPDLALAFEASPAFRNALVRENGAQRARRFGLALSSGKKINESASFQYIGLINGATSEIEASFDFDGRDLVPGRIVAIIGRNAVGKTQFLASLAEDLAQTTRTSSARIKERDARFLDHRPLYTRVIAISYSAFDKFKRPAVDSAASYIYCGIRNDKGTLSLSTLNKTYKSNLQRIRDRGLQEDWISHMETILGDFNEDITATLNGEIYAHLPTPSTLSVLSSGQSILAHLVTALLAWIQPGSMVLFDEPETHLHPNAVASLFIVLSNILRKNDSYAIVATHSPVVIQEVPAKRVLVFQREQNITTAHSLETESFGESVTELTRQVFETIDIQSVYRGTLRKLAQRETIEEVLSRFNLGLSMSAEAYLLAQYAKKAKKK